MRRRRAAAGAAIGLGLACALAGCGIRATSVPVDAGPAPTRGWCALPDTGTLTDALGMMPLQIYLVCGQRLSPVERSVRERQLAPVETARLLLGELERPPDQAEQRGGFASEVPATLNVSGPVAGDPAGTLRLDQDPDDLPPYAVGQLVCTFADTQAGAADHSVVLGGPDPRVPPRRYACGDELRSDPDAGPTAGVPVPSS